MAFATHMPWASFLSSETFVNPWASIRALACISGVAGCAWAAGGLAGCFASYWANAAPAVRLAMAAMRITERMVHLHWDQTPKSQLQCRQIVSETFFCHSQGKAAGELRR